MSPFFALTKSFLAFKITNLLFIALISYSVYIISKKNIKAFWLIILSPITWYLAPWASPIIISSFFLLWSWYYLEKYDKGLSKRTLLYAGALLGLAWAFWDTMLFFGVFLALPFLFNKKLSHSFLFCSAVLVGLLPRLILDYVLFNFPFFTIAKNLLGILAIAVFLKNSSVSLVWHIVPIILILVMMPLYFWRGIRPSLIKPEKKMLIFLTLSLVFVLLSNPQPRYLMALIPMMIVFSIQYMNRVQWRKQILFSIVVSIIVIIPYILQIGYHLGNDVHGIELVAVVAEINNLHISTINPSDLITEDLKEIEKEFSGESFIVGNTADSYNSLARFYNGKEIKEFISIQDYKLWLNNETDLFKKRFAPISNIGDRRYIWIEGGIGRNPSDTTDYKSLKYVLSLEKRLDLEGFKLINSYKILNLWKK